MASMPYSHGRPSAAISKPEIAGPTTMPTWSITCMVAYAGVSWSAATSEGTAAVAAVATTPESPAATAVTR